MTDLRHETDATPQLGPHYPAFQLAKVLATSTSHPDPATRARARNKAAQWEAVLANLYTGSVAYGTRAPLPDIPAWATLEVITGGFATGKLLAGGPLLAHERQYLAELPAVPAGEERRALNSYFLTDVGIAELRDRLETGCYAISVPEEGALLVVAALVARNRIAAARELIAELSPYFARLRFYPQPRSRPLPASSRVHLQTVGSTREVLNAIAPQAGVFAQKEAVEVWAPFHDRVVALFLETEIAGEPCRQFPPGWARRARSLLAEYASLRQIHNRCRKPERAKGHQAQLRTFLQQCATRPEALSAQQVRQIRFILECYIAKRGRPDPAERTAARRRQAAAVSAPTHHAIARAVAARLDAYPGDSGLDDATPLQDFAEDTSEIPAGTSVPASIRRKVERCLNGTLDESIEKGLITSGETLARVLPQVTSRLRAASLTDPGLRRLDAALYRAFRTRRSLLLLNLERQVQIEELP